VKLAAGQRVLALSGGVGGAKLALGLSKLLAPEQLTVVANTGDDFLHFGLHVAPDLDTVMYTLAGLNNTEQGWGLAGESWACLEAIERLGGESWFRLGDRDLATHLRRTSALAGGASLSVITRQLCDALGVRQRLLPMSDDPVRTVVESELGPLAFQHYFVRLQCEPAVSGFRFDGIDNAAPQPEFLAALDDPALAAVVICPSNPWVSVDPILGLPGVSEALAATAAPVVAVSPIVGGLALKGPAAKMMAELGLPVSATGVAEHYRGLVDCFVVDSTDVTLAAGIEKLGMQVLVTNTVMRTDEDKLSLADQIIGRVVGS
jgi:LPPG:FO 2-phospho-L-lactate transferase